ncbi:LapA family protein [Oceanobacillus senegalensis]|uniref:LapA family protein n=1 Tax=Oceanobacillus senegalensis TaxID=1936063 RepID=UPI000A305EAE|nr:lipopolysaccharide assembly protein LapA domain-containing protein [Oceanobacillus senegalensis]
MKGQTYVILAIILVIIITVFAIMNVEPVEVNFFFWNGEIPLILVILFSVLMGGLITAAVGAIKMFQLQRENKRLKNTNKALEVKREHYMQENQLEEVKENMGNVEGEKEE